MRAAQKVAAAAAASSPEPPVTGEQAAVGAAASAAISEPKSEEEEEPEEEKPPVNYGEIYETVTLQWSKRLAEAQETLTKGLSDDNPVVIAARLIVLAESDRITGMIAAMDAEDEGRVPDPPKCTARSLACVALVSVHLRGCVRVDACVCVCVPCLVVCHA